MEMKKKKRKKSQLQLTSPFEETAYRGSVGTYLQKSSSGCPFSLLRLKVSSSLILPPEQQLRLPISTLKVEGELFSLDAICESLGSQSDTWCGMRIITLEWRHSSQDFQATGLCTGCIHLLLSRDCVSVDKLGFSK